LRRRQDRSLVHRSREMETGNNKRKSVKSQDEKAKRSRDRLMKKQGNDISAFLLRAKRDVDFWQSNQCADLRDFCRYAASHPSQFPMGLNDTPLVDAQDPNPLLESIPNLSEGFIDRISSRAHTEIIIPIALLLFLGERATCSART